MRTRKQHKYKLTTGLLLLFILPMNYAAAQDKKMEKLSSSFRTGNNPQLYIDSAGYYLKKDPQKSFGYVEKALTTSIAGHNQLTEGRSYNTLGMINDEIKQYDIAHSYYKKAVQVFISMGNNRELNQTYIYYARSFLAVNDNQAGIDLLNKALSYYEAVNNQNKISEIKQLLGDAYSGMGENKKALQYLDDALEHERKVENTPAVAAVQQKIGNVYFDANKNEEAIVNYNQSVQSARAANDQELLSNTLKTKSKALRKSKMYSEELKVREELNDINLKEANYTEAARNKMEIADIYLEMDQDDEAEQNILESIKITEKSGDIEGKGAAFKKLSTVYGKNKEYDKALEAYKNYVASVDKIHAQQKEEISTSIELYASLNRKLERLNMLEQDVELNRKSMSLLLQEQNLNKKALDYQKKITYALLVIIFALSLASFLIYRSSLNKRKANLLLALKSLRSQMNPHFIYNSLNSINNFIAKNDERSANKYLSSFSKLMRSVMDNSKDDFVILSSEINILKLYLELENSRFPDKFEYHLDIDEHIDQDQYMIPPMLIQPFLENAIWHGLRYKSTKGSLTLIITKSTGGLIIIIEDDGIGRHKSAEMKTRYQKEHKSSGLKNIDSRVGIIKNVFKLHIEIDIQDVDQENQTGTRVTIRIPERISEK